GDPHDEHRQPREDPGEDRKQTTHLTLRSCLCRSSGYLPRRCSLLSRASTHRQAEGPWLGLWPVRMAGASPGRDEPRPPGMPYPPTPSSSSRRLPTVMLARDAGRPESPTLVLVEGLGRLIDVVADREGDLGRCR